MSSGASRDRTVILGAGLFGCALAFHLSRLDARPVELLDRGPVGGGSTGASAGILAHAGWDAWDLSLVRESASEYARLRDRTGAGGYRENGGVRIARSREGARWIERVAATLRPRLPSVRLLGKAELADLLPTADLGEVAAALFVPEDAVFSPSELARSYATEAVGRGVRLAENAGALEVRPEGAGWAVEGPGLRLDASRVVLAAGPWNGPILASLGSPLPLAPFRSKALLLRPAPLAPAGPTLHDDDLALYLRPVARGRMLIGDGTERRASPPGEPGDLTGFAEATAASARELFPARRALTVEHAWSGHCVSTPDRFPIVGRVPAAKGLFLAGGFNGFGAMRAGGLARALAVGIVRDRWEMLAPADPARFPPSAAPFDPVPEWPLESEALLAEAERGASLAPPPSLPAVPTRGTFEDERMRYRALRTPAEARARALPPLSEWFDPFLPFFLAEALRARGVAEVALREGRPVGVYLFSPAEGTASVFGRVPEVERHYLRRGAPGGTYLEGVPPAGAERVELFAADLRDWELPAPPRHPVRIAGADDLARVEAFLQEVAGPVDAAWFRGLPPEETCFLAEANGRVAGVSWATIVGRHARGHTFAVHPRYRGLGVGTDLLHGRMTWLQELGVADVVSEIYAGNAASRTAAERAGMAFVGEMYHAAGGTIRSGAPRTEDTPSPSNR
jgi:glycine/D-amino acid oxidase-like deaminating enzyme/RimJ/RimL family protein N-acetyltransferase